MVHSKIKFLEILNFLSKFFGYDRFLFFCIIFYSFDYIYKVIDYRTLSNDYEIMV
jgi:hypothetical protein